MKKAFTLAEVLITIVVIGIIAAITTPIIMTNYQKQTCVKKFKKVYSTYTQAINRATVEHGPTSNWTYDNAENFSKRYLVPYLQVLKAGSGAEYNYEIKKLNGDAAGTSTNFSKGFKIFLADGSVISSHIYSPTNPSAETIIDVNGQKGPNTIGKDIYFLVFYHEILHPYRAKITPVGEVSDAVKEMIKKIEKDMLRTDGTYGCNKKAGGECCSTLIMENSWELPKDYPW